MFFCDVMSRLVDSVGIECLGKCVLAGLLGCHYAEKEDDAILLPVAFADFL